MKELQFPNRITVELTNQCNVSCTFCPRQSVKMPIGYMDMELYRKIIDEASEHLPVKLVCFFRGESLLHPQFCECVKYAKEKGVGPIQFASNALALGEEEADKILEAGVDFISFSLDTLNEETYKKTRQYGDLKTSVQNVIRLSEKCQKRRKDGLSAPVLQVSTIELEEYINEQADFIEFWKQYVDIVRVYYEHDENGKFRNKSVREMLPQMKKRQPCRKVFTDFLIYWNGECSLCNYDWMGGLQGLNVNEMSIEEAWKSEQYQKIRDMHNSSRFDADIMCKDCEHWRIDYMPEGYLGKMYKGVNRNEDGGA